MLRWLILIFLAIWVFFATIGAFIGYWVVYNPKIERLAEKGVGIYGTVTGKDRDDHGAIFYKYLVDQAIYEGRGGSGGGNPRFDEINIGDNLIVYYDPENPKTSYAGYPQWETGSKYTVAIFLAIVLPFWPLVSYSIVAVVIYLSSRKPKVGEA